MAYAGMGEDAWVIKGLCIIGCRIGDAGRDSECMGGGTGDTARECEPYWCIGFGEVMYCCPPQAPPCTIDIGLSNPPAVLAPAVFGRSLSRLDMLETGRRSLLTFGLPLILPLTVPPI
jgi:hypothetical protein